MEILVVEDLQNDTHTQYESIKCLQKVIQKEFKHPQRVMALDARMLGVLFFKRKPELIRRVELVFFFAVICMQLIKKYM